MLGIFGSFYVRRKARIQRPNQNIRQTEGCDIDKGKLSGEGIQKQELPGQTVALEGYSVMRTYHSTPYELPAT